MKGSPILGSIILAICGSMMFNQGVTGTFNYVIGIYYLISEHFRHSVFGKT